MKDEECPELNLKKYRLIDNIKNEVKNHKIKYIAILIGIILFLAYFLTILIIVVNHSKQINDFKKQTNRKFAYLNNEVNETKALLSQKESEINELQIIISDLSKEIKNLENNLMKKDEEISKQITLNFNISNDNIIDLKNELIVHKEEFLKQNSTNYILINDNINKIESEIQQKSEEITKQNIINYNLLTDYINDIEKELKFNDEENFKQNLQQINLLNNSINQVETNIIKLDYNLSILIKFNIRILADFYIGGNQANLCSNNAAADKIDDSRMKLMIHQKNDQGCFWEVYQNGNSFEFTQSTNTALNGWKIDIFNNDIITTRTNFGSSFSFEASSKYKYYKIKSIETGKYLQIDLNKKRDNYSYFITLVSDKKIASDFMLQLS